MPNQSRPHATPAMIPARAKAQPPASQSNPVLTIFQRMARQMIFDFMADIQYADIKVVEQFQQGETHQFMSANAGHDNSEYAKVTEGKVMEISLTVNHPRFYTRLLTGGNIAAAESYIDGDWRVVGDISQLTQLLTVMASNTAVFGKLEGYMAWVSKWFATLSHRFKHNDKANAKKNILAHYDLGNEMYQLFLDDSMMYSSAMYPKADTSLAEAQVHKLHTICQKLKLSADDSVIEIGTGWGGFAIFAATHYGCHVTTTTISDAQYAEAEKRVKEANLTDKVTLLRLDYRDLVGTYDKLVSIEMIEAVGYEYLPTFFSVCNRLLKPSGQMLIQAITFADQGYQNYLKQADFIQKHIFPGGCLLANHDMLNHIAKHTDMVVRQLDDFGMDYARTLSDWNKAFTAKIEQLYALGYDERFIRLWQYYFCYCEAGFLSQKTSVVHLLAAKPTVSV